MPPRRLEDVYSIVTTKAAAEEKVRLLHVASALSPSELEALDPTFTNDNDVMKFLWIKLSEKAPVGEAEDNNLKALVKRHMPQADFMQLPLDDIRYNGDPTSPGRGFDGRRFALSRWDLLAEEGDGITTALEMLQGRTISPTALPQELLRTVHTAEPQTNDLFFRDACGRISSIYAANRVQLVWKLAPRSEQDNTRPDFELAPPWGGDAVMVGEGKFPSVLDQVTLSEYVMEARAHPMRHRQSPGCAVEQQCGYMDTRRMRYGFLTTYRFTFFLKYMGPKHYAITDAILSSAAPAARLPSPSVVAILYYLCEKARAEGLVQEVLLTAPSEVAPIGKSNAPRRSPRLAGRSDQSAGPPAKLAKTQEAGGHGALGQDDAPASTTYCGSMPNMIPDDALRVGGQLGVGLCGIVDHGWWYGKEAAIKSVDAHNSSHLILHLQRERDVLSGRLQDLQGVCVPTLYASGYWRGYLMFALATSFIHGRHPEAGQESAAATASAEQALRDIHARGVAHNDICEDNILIDDDGKVWFIHFGASTTDPSPEQCAEELQELRLIFTAVVSVGSDNTVHNRE